VSVGATPATSSGYDDFVFFEGLEATERAPLFHRVGHSPELQFTLFFANVKNAVASHLALPGPVHKSRSSQHSNTSLRLRRCEGWAFSRAVTSFSAVHLSTLSHTTPSPRCCANALSYAC